MFIVTMRDESTWEIQDYVHIEKSDGNRVKKAIELLCDTDEFVWKRLNDKLPKYNVETTYYNNRNVPYIVNTVVTVCPVTVLC